MLNHIMFLQSFSKERKKFIKKSQNQNLKLIQPIAAATKNFKKKSLQSQFANQSKILLSNLQFLNSH